MRKSEVPQNKHFHSRRLLVSFARHPLVITKTSRRAGSKSIPQGRLGSFEGTWIEWWQAKMPGQDNCCVPGCTNSHNCSGAAFLFSIVTCPSKRSQVPLRCWFRPRFPFVLVMTHWLLTSCPVSHFSYALVSFLGRSLVSCFVLFFYLPLVLCQCHTKQRKLLVFLWRIANGNSTSIKSTLCFFQERWVGGVDLWHNSWIHNNVWGFQNSSLWNRVAKHYGCKRARHCGLIATRPQVTHPLLQVNTSQVWTAWTNIHQKTSAVALAFEEVRIPHASGREVCVQKFGNAYQRKEINDAFQKHLPDSAK